MPAQRLVDRVVDHLIDQVVQPHLAGRADIHRRPQPHRRQTLKNRNILGRVAATLFLPGGSVLDFACFKL